MSYLSDILLRAVTQRQIPPMNGAAGAGPQAGPGVAGQPALLPPSLQAKFPVFPTLPSQGPMSQLANQMAGPLPQNPAAQPSGNPLIPGHPRIPQPVMGGMQGMQLPPGLTSPLQLLQLLGMGGYGA